MDALGDYDLDDAYDWLKGILGGVFATVIWDETKDTIADVIGATLPITGDTKDCTDESGQVYATVGIDQECPEPPPVGAGFDCDSVNKSGGMVETEAQCGGCLQGYDPDGQGGCVEAPIECPGEQVYNDLTAKCEDPEPGFVEGDPCKTEAGESGTYDAQGTCVADAVEPTPCVNNATLESNCEKCSDGSLPSEHENGDCSQPKTATSDPEGGEDGPPCDQPQPGGFEGVAWAYKCRDTHCPDGTPKSEDPDCTGGELVETSPCDSQNRVTNEDGSCGECLPGFTPDPEGFDQCIQAPPECNDCNCAEYAAANPIECTECPDGESYCASTGQCETNGTCPSSEESEEGASTGGGGIGGSGGRSMFAPLNPAITASPQLLTRQDFPITDFLAGIFTNSTGGTNV